MQDAFAKYHPAVNFFFFAGAIGAGVLIPHPVYQLAGIVTGLIYYLLLKGPTGWKLPLSLLPLFCLLTAVNPLFNTAGATPLFHWMGRPYTLEALQYGAAIAAMFMGMTLWFACYQIVLTGDKFSCLFGNLAPSISLILVMVFRLIPNFIRKAKQLSGARQAIGMGIAEHDTTRNKLNAGMAVLGALASWALEGGVVTGDSMCARGYGADLRSSFMIYRMTGANWSLLAAMAGLLTVVIAAACGGQMHVSFDLRYQAAAVSWGWVAYTAYLSIPIALHIKEAIQWHISRSKI